MHQIHACLNFDGTCREAMTSMHQAAFAKVPGGEPPKGAEDRIMHDAFWGARFGMLADRDGINWMFNDELKR